MVTRQVLVLEQLEQQPEELQFQAQARQSLAGESMLMQLPEEVELV